MQNDSSSLGIIIVGALCLLGFGANLYRGAVAHVRSNEMKRQNYLARQVAMAKRQNSGNRKK